MMKLVDVMFKDKYLNLYKLKITSSNQATKLIFATKLLLSFRLCRSDSLMPGFIMEYKCGNSMKLKGGPLDQIEVFSVIFTWHQILCISKAENGTIEDWHENEHVPGG